uniref:Link domain-containing protein n=1 Tax=viral metagenome TaxID=1070528 RepID=A0A6C0KV74_9ZZZZ
MSSPFNFGKLAPAVNAPKANLFPAAAANASATSSTIFGSMTSLILLGVLFVMIFVGIYIYFKTYGYTVKMGWDNLMGLFGKKESVNISSTDDGVSAPIATIVPPPPGSTDSSLSALTGGHGPTPPLPFNPDERPSGMPGARESPSFLNKALSSAEHAFDPEKQVFNVSRNLYTYDESGPLCKAMGAELATYEQVQQAHKHGADWCNYGWVKGQMAVYPTQEATWNKLQQGPAEYRNSCGKPGVNGGIFDNPDLRFGVNCFGPRPQKKDTDELLTDTDMGMPPTAEQIEFDKKVQKFRDQLGNITVLPWSRGNWSG